MTATISIPDAALRRAEDIVTGFVTGRIKTTSLYYEFFRQCCPRLPPNIEAAFEDACKAHAAWEISGGIDRAGLDEALRDLVAVLDGRPNHTRTESAA
ncbi:hypothetical protein [Actinacidiphila oryziradicis]|uniref:hypothetical protein n=1 Tax=Actinacidiphila oryziradicis TaxID=2571141 RepID=UPI0023F2ECE7|nr:hypothetical protein [Actinacidiphila oryziradicis]MCW2868720.1 hypothetical protein [Actinacidiphila oryziradicis]